MRIAIDLQGAQTDSRFRGIGRYSLSLALAMARNAGPHEIWLVLNGQLPESIPEIREAFSGLVPANQIRVFSVPPHRQQDDWSTRAAEVIREQFLESISPDVILVSSLFEGYRSDATTSIGVHTGGERTACVLYDLIPLLHQDQYLASEESRSYYFRKIESLKNAGLLLAISESSRQEGIDHLGMDAAKVVNISTAVGPQFKPNTPTASAASTLLATLGISRRMVMYAPGGFDPRKNFGRLIEAYSQLPKALRSRHQLVIVSKLHPAQRQELLRLRDHFGLAVDELILPGYVEDQDLISLYSLAELFVFPSLHEGFGLPVLEAMACGAPVIGASKTSIPEVIGLDAALFDPESVPAMAAKMAEALTDANFRTMLGEHGLRQAMRFTWDACAQTAIRALEALNVAAPRTVRTAGPIGANRAHIISALAATRAVRPPSDDALRSVALSLAFNEGRNTPQLLLDISTLVHLDAKSGIQRVVRSLLKALLTEPPSAMDVQPIYFANGVYRYARDFCRSKLGHVTGERDDPVDFSQGDSYLSLDLNMHLASEVHNLHMALRSHGVHLAFIVYDILLVQHPEWWAPGTSNMFRTWLANIASVADDLVCISQAVADEVADWLTRNPPQRIERGPRVSSFHLGADVDSSLPTKGIPSSADKVIAQMQSKMSFLMVGTLEPRKGHGQVLQAFEQLWQADQNINLVIVGKQGWLVDALIEQLRTHPELNKRLFWLDGISDEYLEKVYAASTCLIAASYGEGFGLPLIEAAQHKVPIIARDIPVFREVAGTHAYYFDSQTPEALMQSIIEWIALHAAGQHPASNTMPWLTWKESSVRLSHEIQKDG